MISYLIPYYDQLGICYILTLFYFVFHVNFIILDGIYFLFYYETVPIPRGCSITLTGRCYPFEMSGHKDYGSFLINFHRSIQFDCITLTLIFFQGVFIWQYNFEGRGEELYSGVCNQSEMRHADYSSRTFRGNKFLSSCVYLIQLDRLFCPIPLSLTTQIHQHIWLFDVGRNLRTYNHIVKNLKRYSLWREFARARKDKWARRSWRARPPSLSLISSILDLASIPAPWRNN